MPSPVTAYRVRLSARGGASIKTALAQEVIYEWNSTRAWEEHKVLIPFLDEALAEAAPEVDFLIAFFCASQGAPDPAHSRALDAEIEQQVKAGRPALICFSEGRVDFAAVDASEMRDLEDFKSRYPADALIESFKDEKELRAKLAQKIEAIVRYHPHFQVVSEMDPTVAVPEDEPARISEEARELLINACDDPEAYLARFNASGNRKIQVNGKLYASSAEACKWQGAFDELIHQGLIRDAGCNGQLFQISAAGFKYLETQGKFPIGYIAELGGM